MSTQQLVETNREKAEIYTDPTLCKIKSKELLEKINLPRGLLPLDEITEVGYNESTGFVWLKQKKSKTHKFPLIDRLVSYDTDITAFVEDRRMKKLTGVKSREFLIWVTISEISIQDPNSGKITFGTPTGISRSFPVNAFAEEEEKK
ncbi:OLC1v1026379C1 [Oldenlandia corymbosa var. corymbosa]|uniref:OLC1v1026379C1 n=1 Tax=Oldenlandia corymbosa var. corymbosa TaxID=529605 RepID=A0AAV1C6Z2_OLDCO|nr:OLC1v1026379C1 [Oldenlandia corymbosa var. corymbosa]